MSKPTSCSRVRCGLGAAAFGALAWSALIEPRLFAIRRHTLPILPDGAAPIRLLHLSDLHLAPRQNHKIDWVRRLAELRPDALVFTGDLVGHRFARGPLRHALLPFSERGVPGVFVHGSNDYFTPVFKNPLGYLWAPSELGEKEPDFDTEALTADLVELGFTDLNNSATRITVRGTGLEFFGLGDPHIEFDDVELMDAAITSLPRWRRKADPVRLGVVHAPYQRALNHFLRSGAKTIFAGHTHGGQVRVPGVGALTSNSDLPVGQARGLSVWYDAERAAFLNVSAGLGTSIYAPIRFACRPEASLITLESAR